MATQTLLWEAETMTYTFHKHYPQKGGLWHNQHDALERVIDLTCQKCGWQIYTDFEDYHYQNVQHLCGNYKEDWRQGSYKHEHCFQALD